MSSRSPFLTLSKITLVLIYLVIIAGTIVRSTGSGMGCPDWPKCFDKWVPPTDESQLPANYHEIYSDRGYADTTFNVYHTWTEYLNRLLGALLGVFIFIVFLLSLKDRKNNKLIVYLCAAEVLLIGFQGWLGALVVSSNLAPVKVTLHMLVALVIVALFIYIIQKAKNNPVNTTLNQVRKIKTTLIICIALSVLQILIGTKVRERIDLISFSMDYELREKWVSMVGNYFELHRLFAVVLVIVNVYLFWLIKQNSSQDNQLLKNSKWMLILLSAEFLLGIVLSYFSFPAFAQPIHLLLASIIFGIQFFVLVKINKIRVS